MTMNWQDVLTLLIPLLGLMSYLYNRIEKKAEDRQKQTHQEFDKVHQKFEKVYQEFDKVYQEIKDVKKDTSRINERLTRLEGRFDERGYWESREWHRTGTEDKK